MINQTVEWACRYQISADLSRRQLATQQPHEMPLLMLFVGNLTLFTPEQKSKILRQKKLSRNLFPLNYNQNPSPIRTAQGTNSQTSANLNSAAVRAEKRLRQSRYAERRRLPKPRFSQSHKLAIPHPQTKPLKLKIQPSTLKFGGPVEAIPQCLAEILSDVLRALLRWRHRGKES